jgi:type I restriction enzyme S subunit
MKWPQVKLGEVLQRSEETIALEPDCTYREITVKLWGRGVVLRSIVTGADIASSRRFVARLGQLIVSRIDARNGAIGVVPPELDGAVVTNDFPLFVPNPVRVDLAFLGWLSRTRAFVDLCLRASEGTTNRVRLQEDRFLALEIPLPPLADQRRVVARIAELASQVQEARILRQQATDEAEALVMAHSAELFRSASEKGTVSLDTIATLERGKFSHRPRNEPRFFGGAHPWIQIAEIESAGKFIRQWTTTLNEVSL